MPETRDFLRQIQSEAAAGDPPVQGSVLIFADWLEERGDPRADWLRQMSVGPHDSTGKMVVPEGPLFHVFTLNGIALTSHSTEAGALQELSRRVMEAMTQPCVTMTSFNGVQIHDTGHGCAVCHGDGWLLTEAVACECNCMEAISGVMFYCSDCNGRGWRIKSDPVVIPCDDLPEPDADGNYIIHVELPGPTQPRRMVVGRKGEE